jgi:Zn-dependent metalloprotease
MRLTHAKRNTIGIVLAGFTLVTFVSGQVPTPPKPEISDQTNPATDFEVEPRNVSASLSPAQISSAVEVALRAVEAPTGAAAQLKIANPRQELTLSRADRDGSSKWHLRFRQAFKGIPVKDGWLSVHQDENNLTADPVFHGNYVEGAEVDVKPRITKQQAIAAVEALVKQTVKPTAPNLAAGAEQMDASLEVKERPVCEDPRDCGGTSTAVLEIHPGNGPGQRLLTYHVSARDFSGAEPVIIEAWVDNNGRIVESYNNVQTACESGSGLTLYQGLASYFKVAYWPAVNRYVLNDNCLRIGTYDMNNTTGSTYQSASFSKVFGNYTINDRNTTNADVHFSTVQTNSFLYWVLGRTWLNGTGGPRVYQSVDGAGPLISARNHYGSKYNNAFWDGTKINLGDGDGSRFGPLVSLDIVGHEWGHGLTQFTAGLIYKNESGALNESFSDIIGAMTERYWKGESANTWKIGESPFTPKIAGDALRYMNRPTLDGSSRDHYSQRYVGTADSGGVHWNSGIQNNAFYLLAKGGCHRLGTCMSGSIGAGAATQIFYRALRYYMIPTDNFSWARQCTLWAAADLYGKYSFNWYRTQQAWNVVGVPKVID